MVIICSFYFNRVPAVWRASLKLLLIYWMFFYSSDQLFSQKNSVNRGFDSIDFIVFDRYTELTANADFYTAKTEMKDALQKSIQLDYRKGIFWANVRLGNLECTTGDYVKSFLYLNDAKEVRLNKTEYQALAVLDIEFARLFSKSKHSYELAAEYSERAIEKCKKIPDEKTRNSYLGFIYQNLYVTYWFMDQEEVGIAYLHKAEQLATDIYNLNYIAYYHINSTKDLDSARHYLDLSSSYLNSSPHLLYDKAVHWNQWGNYFLSINEPKSAIENFISALALADSILYIDEHLNALDGLVRSYGQIGDYESKLQYLEASTRLQDSISSVNLASEKQVSRQIFETQLNEANLFRQKLLLGIAGLFILVIGLVLWLLWYRKRIRIEKHLKQTKIIEFEKSVSHIERISNDATEELVNLAKSNDICFFTRFQEVYPNLIKALLDINPDLNANELTLCAYIFLGFNNKDIALYTFKSVYTIRNRKHNLRKKLEITDSELDFELFLKQLIM